MSSLPSALRRSKEAWSAVGKPERARAHCKRLGVTINQRTSNITASEVLATDWRAIVPKKPKADDVEAWRIRAIYALDWFLDEMQAAPASRARRDLVAKVEAMMKELGETR